MLNSAALGQATPQVLSVAEPDLGVMERERPDYDAKGIPLGGFRLFPSLRATGSYDDNIFRLPTATADYYVTLVPAVNLKSEWGRHYVGLSAYASYYNYFEQTGENLTDWEVEGTGRVDVTHAATIFAHASFGENHELWSAPDALSFQAAPNRYYQTLATARFTYNPTRLGVSVGGDFNRYDWTDTPLIGGGFLQNSDRNLNKYEAYLRVFYEFSPGYAAFARVTYNDRRFDTPVDRSGLDRSSQGYRYDGGVTLHITHLLRGEAYAGYLTQDFAAGGGLSSIEGFNYGVQLDWFATPVLTLHAGGSRELKDTTFAGISVEDNRRAEISADYELLRNVIVQARGSIVWTKFTGSPLSDTQHLAGVRVEYLVNRYASAYVEYGFEHRTSNRVLADYTSNTVSIGLALHV